MGLELNRWKQQPCDMNRTKHLPASRTLCPIKPPRSGAPHATTVPLPSKAANAPLVDWISCTSTNSSWTFPEFWMFWKTSSQGTTRDYKMLCLGISKLWHRNHVESSNIYIYISKVFTIEAYWSCIQQHQDETTILAVLLATIMVNKIPKLVFSSKPLASPPNLGSPQATTVASAVRAAKAASVAWIFRTWLRWLRCSASTEVTPP